MGSSRHGREHTPQHHHVAARADHRGAVDAAARSRESGPGAGAQASAAVIQIVEREVEAVARETVAALQAEQQRGVDQGYDEAGKRRARHERPRSRRDGMLAPQKPRTDLGGPSLETPRHLDQERVPYRSGWGVDHEGVLVDEGKLAHSTTRPWRMVFSVTTRGSTN